MLERMRDRAEHGVDLSDDFVDGEERTREIVKKILRQRSECRHVAPGCRSPEGRC